LLPKFFKFRAYNDAGVSVTVQVDWLPYTFAAGAPAYHAKATPIASGAVASAAAAISSAIDNSTALDVGGHLMVYATPGASPTGNKQLVVYLIGSDDNSVFEDLQATVGEGLGTVVGTMPLSGTSALHQMIEV